MTEPIQASSDLDELAAAVRESPSGEGLSRLWQAVYGLETWWLLPTGDPADPRPMVGTVNDQTFLLAFTSRPHLVRFADAHRGPAGEGGIPAMSVTPADLTALATTLIGQGVAGIVFNQGVHSFVAPATALDAMWDQFGRAASGR